MLAAGAGCSRCLHQEEGPRTLLGDAPARVFQAVVWERRVQRVLLPLSPTPRTNCSRRPPMAPEGLGGTAFRPMVRL